MGQVPLERDIKIAVNGCSGFATTTQEGPFSAMLISRSRGTFLIPTSFKLALDSHPCWWLCCVWWRSCCICCMSCGRCCRALLSDLGQGGGHLIAAPHLLEGGLWEFTWYSRLADKDISLKFVPYSVLWIILPCVSSVNLISIQVELKRCRNPHCEEWKKGPNDCLFLQFFALPLSNTEQVFWMGRWPPFFVWNLQLLGRRRNT